MSLIPVDDLTTPLTPDQVLEKFLVILETMNMPARSWRQAGVARTILRTVATTYSGFTILMSNAIKAGFLETATGPWLTLLAKYVYGVDRRVSTFATGVITFVNSGGGVYPTVGTYAADQVRVTWVAGKKSYTNTDVFSVPGGSTVYVNFRAVEAGSASSAPPNAITSLETPVMLGVSVTNATSVAGTDEETDADLRQRCRDKLSALSLNGPRGAYSYAAKSAVRLDGSPVDINRISVSASSSTGVVNVYAASPSGVPLSSDLVLVRASIEAIARPDSVTVNVFGVTPVALGATITVWARRTDGVSAADITTLVQSALQAMAQAYPIGGIPKPPSTQGYLYADNIAGTAKGAHPSIYDIDGAGADLALNPGEVVTLGTTVNVTIVDSP
jgi:baseplate J-like protein